MQRVGLYVSAMIVACPFIHGCVPVDPVPVENGGRTGDVAVWPSASMDELEPNDSFQSSTKAELADSVEISGRLDSDHDSDIFDLGALAVSTNLRCSVATGDGGEMSVCLFDEQQRLLARSTVLTPESPRNFELLLPEPVQSLYLLTYVTSGGAPQAYTVTLSVQPEPAVLAYRPQVVLLNFNGADHISVAGRDYDMLPAFDAGTISSQFEGRTEEIIQAMLKDVRADFQGLDVMVYLSSDPLVPPGAYSTVYYGSANPDLLGVADGVDPWNARPTESAIIYTDTFSLFAALNPDANDLARVLANVTSHEVGHLLGLRHTDDPDDLMDVTATARRLMSDQCFRVSPLHSTVAPLGYQDSPTMLAWTVGGRLESLQPAPGKPTLSTARGVDFEIPRRMLCGHCSE